MLDSPYRLTALSMLGGLLSTTGLLGANVPSVRGSWIMLAGCFACIGIGVSTMCWATYTLREGVRNERWSADTIAAFRKVIDHPVWKLVMAILFVAMIAAIVKYWHHRGDYFWSVYILLQTQTQIGAAFTRPVERNARAQIDWSTVLPPISDHWGER